MWGGVSLGIEQVVGGAVSPGIGCLSEQILRALSGTPQDADAVVDVASVETQAIGDELENRSQHLLQVQVGHL